MILWDPNGLHARECPCLECDMGYGPTELQRAAADRDLRARAFALSLPVPKNRRERKRMEAEEAHRRAVAETDKLAAKLAAEVPPPMSETDLAELARERRELFGSPKKGTKCGRP